MARYKVLRKTWDSDACRLYEEGEILDKDFPDHVKISSNLELIADDSDPESTEDGKSKRRKPDPAA